MHIVLLLYEWICMHVNDMKLWKRLIEPDTITKLFDLYKRILTLYIYLSTQLPNVFNVVLTCSHNLPFEVTVACVHHTIIITRFMLPFSFLEFLWRTIKSWEWVNLSNLFVMSKFVQESTHTQRHKVYLHIYLLSPSPHNIVSVESAPILWWGSYL